MAVKEGAGLRYFSFDVDFFIDEKIEFVSARFGIKGEVIAIKLLCKIYRNGYYTEWTNDDAMIFAKRVGDGVTYSLVNDVVTELVKRGFFDKDILSRLNILTSTGIQKRYFEATIRRKNVQVLSSLLLVNVEKFQNVNIIEENVNISPLNENISEQSKVKQSKVNERSFNRADESDFEHEHSPTPQPAFMHHVPQDIDLLKEKCILDSGYFTNLYCMKYSIDKNCLYAWLQNFNNHLHVDGVNVKTEKDYRGHFRNWFSKQTNIKEPGKWRLRTGSNDSKQTESKISPQLKTLN